MYLESLKIGDRVSIYTNYIEEKGYEGEAILLEKKSEGDTFFLPDEFTNSNPDMKLTPDKKKNAYNEFIFEVINSDCRKVKRFVKEILYLRKNKLSDYNNMYQCVSRWRDLMHIDEISGIIYEDSKFKRMLRYIPVDYITRYFQQYEKKVNNTIFKYETWRVLFTLENGLEANRIVIRKIRLVIKNNYKEFNGNSELTNYMTYNGKTYINKKEDE